MENFKLITDRTPLTPEEIQTHKNFTQVLQKYNKLPVKFYKTGWFKAGLATVTVAATGTLLFFATGTTKNNTPVKSAHAVTNQSSPYADETPCVKSPVAQLDVPLKNFTLNASRDTVIFYETGSAIAYKANTLVDENGNAVKGLFTLQYREFHNPVEIFASGIPMAYDSLKTHWNLKSAGMLEIKAVQNGKDVRIKEGSTLAIQLKSNVSGTDYNVYYLDTNKRNWAYEGKDQLLSNKIELPEQNQHVPYKPKKIVLDTLAIKKQLAPMQPVKPRHADPKAFTFTLDVLADEFPELGVYGNTKFEVIDNKNTFSSQVYSTEWEDIALKEITKGEKYELTLTRGLIVKTVVAIPVLEGNDYKTALETYNAKYKLYEQKLATRLKEEKNKLEAENKKQSEWEQKAQQQHHSRIQNLTAQNLPEAEVLARFSGTNSTKSLVTRAFTVNNFGVWNCDKPLDYPNGEKVMASFCDQEGNPIILDMVFLSEKENKMLYNYAATDFKRFKFDTKQTNAVWGVMADGKLVYALNEAFSLENLKGNRMIFHMNIVHDKLKTLKQVKALLGV